MPAKRENLLEQLNTLIYTIAEMRKSGQTDLAAVAEEQMKDVQKRLNEANKALAGKNMLND